MSKETNDVTKAVWIWWPLVTIAALASYTSAPPLSARWLTVAPPGSAFLAAAAAHTVWIVSTVQRRNIILRIAAWLICLRLASGGLTLLTNYPGTFPALALETLLLLAAMSAAPAIPLTDQLGAWRRARESAMAQLALIDGILPWVAAFSRRFFANRADPQVASARLDRAQIVAELEDAEALAASQQRKIR
jgi:hypothetical protein